MLHLRWIILLTGLSLSLAACGTKGSLFLPPKTQTSATDKPLSEPSVAAQDPKTTDSNDLTTSTQP